MQGSKPDPVWVANEFVRRYYEVGPTSGACAPVFAQGASLRALIRGRPLPACRRC